MKNLSKSKDSLNNKDKKILAKTRPTKIALKRAIEKSIEKNKKTLKILAKR